MNSDSTRRKRVDVRDKTIFPNIDALILGETRKGKSRISQIKVDVSVAWGKNNARKGSCTDKRI